MKPDSEIQERIRTLLTEEFERRANEAEARLPSSCVYNHRQPLDSRKQVDGGENAGFNRITRVDHVSLPVVQSIGLCMFGAEDPAHWPGTICEDPVDAKLCPPQAFTPKITREALQEQFTGQIKDLPWVKVNLPEVHALLWVLGSESIPEPSPREVEEPTHELPVLLVLSRWQKFFMWLAGLSRHGVYAVKNDAVRSTGEGP
jgi:hypothetical protein